MKLLQWLVVFPQVVSRMCHKNEYVWESLLLIMTKVLCEFPHHGIWAMLSAAKSTNARRSKRCATAFLKAKVRLEGFGF